MAKINLLDENTTQKIKRKKLLKAGIFISGVYNLRRTNMAAVFRSYDGQLENTSSMSDVADVFRTHCNLINFALFKSRTPNSFGQYHVV